MFRLFLSCADLRLIIFYKLFFPDLLSELIPSVRLEKNENKTPEEQKGFPKRTETLLS
jgi:hypothetical protein